MFVLLEEDSNIIDLFNVDFLFFYIFFIDELWIIIIINIEYGNLKRELYLVFCGSEGYIWICGNDNMLRFYIFWGEFLRLI